MVVAVEGNWNEARRARRVVWFLLPEQTTLLGHSEDRQEAYTIGKYPDTTEIATESNKASHMKPHDGSQQSFGM